jgi:uncharacterized protein (DUF2164 family)
MVREMLLLKIPRENKDDIIASIQQYFTEEMDESIGNLAAENLLDFIIKEVSPFVYNQALSDARKVVGEKLLALEDELYTLERPIKRSGR